MYFNDHAMVSKQFNITVFIYQEKSPLYEAGHAITFPGGTYRQYSVWVRPAFVTNGKKHEVKTW